MCRLALRTQWAALRWLNSVGAGGEPPGDDAKRGRLVDLEALRRERALRPPAERTQPAPLRLCGRDEAAERLAALVDAGGQVVEIWQGGAPPYLAAAPSTTTASP